MKISVLTPDLSHNCLGRAYLLAKILKRHYEVEIIGPIFKNGIWPPLAELSDLSYKFVKLTGGDEDYRQLKELFKKVNGDVIYASKPFFTSFGIGLLKKLIGRRPLMLDIDDWQTGFMKEYYKNLSRGRRLKDLAYYVRHPYTLSHWNSFVYEKLSWLANEVTVSNNFLKEKFGGTIVWHARDTDAFNPERFDKEFIIKKYGIRKKKIVMFFGTPLPYKGIEDLIQAINLLPDRDILLILVGIGTNSKYVKLASEKLGERFKMFGLQPFQKVPEFLAMSDVVVIPQRNNFATVGQLPAKVFDAMAMAKPVIATNVCDIAKVLDGCGYIVEPDNPRQLTETIQYVLTYQEEALQMGLKARKKFEENYSYSAVEKTLLPIFKKYE